MTPFQLAGGRSLPPLLFVTCPSALPAFAPAETVASLQALIPEPHRVVELPDAGDPPTLAQQLREQASGFEVEGVVLIGGWDKLPAQLVRAVDHDLLARVGVNGEADHFLTWNDDLYGDLDGDGLPELPVSRIPSGVNLRRALAATRPADAPERRRWRAVRVKEFGYADRVYDGLDQTRTLPILNYESDIDTILRREGLGADYAYFACHSFPDKTERFSESGPGNVVNVKRVPDADESVVLAACCYSALLGRKSPLGASSSGTVRPVMLPKQRSIALSYIDKGARAFIGFTALIWTPDEDPFDYLAAPLQRGFWDKVTTHQIAPARALFEAKAEFILNTPYPNPDVPHKLSQDESTAKHLKDYWSATCLGLGW